MFCLKWLDEQLTVIHRGCGCVLEIINGDDLGIKLCEEHSIEADKHDSAEYIEKFILEMFTP